MLRQQCATGQQVPEPNNGIVILFYAGSTIRTASMRVRGDCWAANKRSNPFRTISAFYKGPFTEDVVVLPLRMQDGALGINIVELATTCWMELPRCVNDKDGGSFGATLLSRPHYPLHGESGPWAHLPPASQCVCCRRQLQNEKPRLEAPPAFERISKVTSQTVSLVFVAPTPTAGHA